MSENEEAIEVNDDGSVVIHNPEQREIMLSLMQLQNDCNETLGLALLDRAENESLAVEDDAADWDELSCDDARRFISVTGGLGWIVTVSPADPSCARLRAYLADHLRSRGWDDVEVVTQW